MRKSCPKRKPSTATRERAGPRTAAGKNASFLQPGKMNTGRRGEKKKPAPGHQRKNLLLSRKGEKPHPSTASGGGGGGTALFFAREGKTHPLGAEGGEKGRRARRFLPSWDLRKKKADELVFSRDSGPSPDRAAGREKKGRDLLAKEKKGGPLFGRGGGALRAEKDGEIRVPGERKGDLTSQSERSLRSGEQGYHQAASWPGGGGERGKPFSIAIYLLGGERGIQTPMAGRYYWGSIVRGPRKASRKNSSPSSYRKKKRGRASLFRKEGRLGKRLIFCEAAPEKGEEKNRPDPSLPDRREKRGVKNPSTSSLEAEGGRKRKRRRHCGGVKKRGSDRSITFPRGEKGQSLSHHLGEKKGGTYRFPHRKGGDWGHRLYPPLDDLTLPFGEPPRGKAYFSMM